jgi:hypothetical protein
MNATRYTTRLAKGKLRFETERTRFEHETFTDVDPNQILIIKEGSGIIQRTMPDLKTN